MANSDVRRARFKIKSESMKKFMAAKNASPELQLNLKQYLMFLEERFLCWQT